MPGKTGNATQQSCLPITPDALCKIKVAWKKEGLNHDKIMLWAAFTICFFRLLRSGEVCSGTNGPFQGSHVTGHWNRQHGEPSNSLFPTEILQNRLIKGRVRYFCHKNAEQALSSVSCPSWCGLLTKKLIRKPPSFIFSQVTPYSQCICNLLQGGIHYRGNRYNTILRPQFQDRGCHCSGKKRLKRLSDKAVKSMEKFCVSEVLTPSPAILGYLASSISADHQTGGNQSEGLMID